MSLYKTLFALAAATTLAMASPTSSGMTGTEAAQQCGNNQVIACCDSSNDLLGANCLSIPVLSIPVEQACGSNVASCCQGDSSSGLINISAQCSPLIL